MSSKTISGEQAFALRRSLGISQADFWERLGVTQSGGSRYEKDRPIPKFVYLLMQLAYYNNPEQILKSVRHRRRSR